MGNKYFYSFYECDNCNHAFGEYENNLSNFGGILNTIMGLKGKNGFPKFKSRKKDTTTTFENGGIVTRIKTSSHEDLKSISLSKSKDFVTFHDAMRPYTPVHAFKALVKIAFCLLPENELVNYEVTRKWLIGEGDLDDATIGLCRVFYRLNNTRFEHPWTILFKKKPIENSTCPTHAMTIFYGLISMQIFLPGNQNDNWIYDGGKMSMPIEENITTITITDNKKNFRSNMRDWSSNKVVHNKESLTVGLRPK